MSFWPIVFIVLATAMVIGPIMLMQPSQRDRHLASLRQKAAEKGLLVRLDTYHRNAGEKQSVAVYSLVVTRPENAICWCLMKSPYVHDLHFHHCWQWSNNSPTLSSPMTVAIQHCLDDLPAEIVGIELTQNSIGFWWTERGEWTVDTLKSSLEEVYTLV